MSAIIDGSNASSLPADSTINGVTVGKGGGSTSTNTVVGNGALAATSSGGGTSAFGYLALAANTSGAANSAYGYQALNANTTGQTNTGIGYASLNVNTTGSSNTGIGYQALVANTTASNNTAVGYQAGYSNTTANNNTFIGTYAGYSVTTGTANTFIGNGQNPAGYYVTTGSKNSILGGYSGNQGSLDIRTTSNYIVLSDGDGNPRNYIDSSGYNYLLGSGGGRIYFRDTSNTAQYSIQSTSGTFYIFSAANYAFLSGTGFSSWSFASDARIKENIVDLDYGLNSIMALKPRRFDYISNKQNDIGFIAQEIQSVIPEAVTGKEIEFSENDTQQERAEKTMGVSKDLLIPVLVKAIQELKAEFDAYKASHP